MPKIHWLRPALTIPIMTAACSIIIDPAPSPQQCDPDFEGLCPEGEVCTEDDDGVFRCLEESIVPPECTSHDDCRFEGSTKTFCLDRSCVQCLEHGDCEPVEGGQYCYENTCVPGCDVDSSCCCPEGDRCIQGQCRSPQEEECNNEDDDFDGDTDENFDQDSDGFSSCPFVNPIPDCDDDNNRVHPGAEEICDGVDNDCDREIDEGDSCPDGQVCDLQSHVCVPSVDLCDGDEDCEPIEFCHDNGLCYPREVAFGAQCLVDDQCEWGRCMATGSVGPGDQRCTDVCCNESDCPPGAWCADNGDGLKLCAPSDWHGAFELSCGSSRCPACQLGRCYDQCCGDTDCGSSCQLGTVSTPLGSITTTVCDVRSGTSELAQGLYEFSQCGDIGDLLFTFCSSGYSYVTEISWGVAVECLCTAPCCSDASCRASGADPGARCVVPLPELGVSMCYPPSVLVDLGSKTYGESCSSWDECQSGVCHPLGYCTQTCCPGGGCPSGATCLPYTFGTETSNYCTRP